MTQKNEPAADNAAPPEAEPQASVEDESLAGREINRMNIIHRFENGMYPYPRKIGRVAYEKERRNCRSSAEGAEMGQG